MAQQEDQKDGMKFCCSVCLALLKDPVTIPCGHNYCMKCIQTFWCEGENKTYSCPQCRQSFEQSPALVKNTLLAELVEELQQAGLHAPAADHCYAEPEDVACDVCTGRKRKAVKSCLVCLASYCRQHLQPHYQSRNFQKHKLVEASVKLQETICPHHDEVMKIFCRTDQQCICYLCSMKEHQGHDVTSTEAERAERQKELEEMLEKVQERIRDKEKDVKILQQVVKDINTAADRAVEETGKILTQSIYTIKKKIADAKQQIRDQQQQKVVQAEEHEKILSNEISELKRKQTELEQLSHNEDHTQFLHSYPSVSALGESTDSNSTIIHHLHNFNDMTAAATETRDKIRAILSRKTLQTAPPELGIKQTEPRTRAEFLKYSCQITLDPDTASNGLLLSNENRCVTKSHGHSPSTHPDRFVGLSQVISKNELTGCCYWEVEKKGKVSVAVTYRDISRSGDFSACALGHNKKSWAFTFDDGFTFRHGASTFITSHQLSTIGVYLDHSAGTLSFYNISGKMTLLHRVQTKFTQPLYAGLWLHGADGDSAEFCELE